MATDLEPQAGTYSDGRVRWGIDSVTHALVPNPLDTGTLDIGASDAKVGAIYSTKGWGTGSALLTSTKGATWTQFFNEEEITLSTSGTTTDTTANVLPANSIILFVGAIVTTSIATATDWKLGDATVTGRFAAVNSTMTAGATTLGFAHMFGVVSATNAGPTQASAAKLRITTTGTPSAGAIRVCVMGYTFSAPTS